MGSYWFYRSYLLTCLGFSGKIDDKIGKTKFERTYPSYLYNKRPKCIQYAPPSMHIVILLWKNLKISLFRASYRHSTRFIVFFFFKVADCDKFTRDRKLHMSMDLKVSAIASIINPPTSKSSTYIRIYNSKCKLFNRTNGCANLSSVATQLYSPLGLTPLKSRTHAVIAMTLSLSLNTHFK